MELNVCVSIGKPESDSSSGIITSPRGKKKQVEGEGRQTRRKAEPSHDSHSEQLCLALVSSHNWAKSVVSRRIEPNWFLCQESVGEVF